MEAVQNTALESVRPDAGQETEIAPSTTIFSRDPEEAFSQAERLVQAVTRRCKGPAYLVNIQGKLYPTVSWWSVAASSLSLFPRVVWTKRLDREGEIAYEARVEVHHNDQVISAGEAMCSNREERWRTCPEYSIRSMAQTRAAGKAFRIPLSFLAVMAGLESTPAEEMDFQARDRYGDHEPHGAGSNHTQGNETPLEGATARQIATLENLLDDQRLSEGERQDLKVKLSAGMTKATANELLNYLLGKSIYQDGRWIRVEEGVLAERTNNRSH